MLHATAILYVSFMQYLEHDPSMKKVWYQSISYSYFEILSALTT